VVTDVAQRMKNSYIAHCHAFTDIKDRNKLHVEAKMTHNGLEAYYMSRASLTTEVDEHR